MSAQAKPININGIPKSEPIAIPPRSPHVNSDKTTQKTAQVFESKSNPEAIRDKRLEAFESDSDKSTEESTEDSSDESISCSAPVLNKRANDFFNQHFSRQQTNRPTSRK